MWEVLEAALYKKKSLGSQATVWSPLTYSLLILGKDNCPVTSHHSLFVTAKVSPVPFSSSESDYLALIMASGFSGILGHPAPCCDTVLCSTPDVSQLR